MSQPTEKQIAFITDLADRILAAKVAPNAKATRFYNPTRLLAARQVQARAARADIASGFISTSVGASHRIEELLVAAKSVEA